MKIPEYNIQMPSQFKPYYKQNIRFLWSSLKKFYTIFFKIVRFFFFYFSKCFLKKNLSSRFVSMILNGKTDEIQRKRVIKKLQKSNDFFKRFHRVVTTYLLIYYMRLSIFIILFFFISFLQIFTVKIRDL